MKFRSLCSLLLICIVLFACNKKDNNTTPTGNSDKINISNFAFNSSSLTVSAGTTITWTNNDATAHTVTADDNSYTSGTLNQGDTYSHTFTTAGTYSYHCQFHTMMQGSVTVQ